ncbi:MAG TPA: alpha/beta fold hydrolase [Kofleriaceae bacterium]|jgi:haloalkane dehalogenase
MMLEQGEVVVDELRIHYAACGPKGGHPVLLVHGWPTSSRLWREVMPALGEAGARAIAIDLPGFGGSSKPPGASYSFRFYDRAIDGFLTALGVETLDLVVHDLGGPLGLHWAALHPARVRRLGLLNTIVYPQLSWAVVAFVAASKLPGVKQWLTSPRGLAWAMQFGVARKLAPDEIAAYQAPFAEHDARVALRKAAGGNLHRDGMREIERYIQQLTIPVRVIYGDRDPILPEVGKTFARVKRDVPHAEVTVLAGAKHFVQEDRPREVAELLAQFLSP